MRLEPWFVTGLVEGEGSFCISFNRRKKLKVGIETRPSFSVTLSSKDLELIKALRNFFGCGGVRYSRGDRTYKFEVRSITDIIKKINPHFYKYPLKGSKAKDFQLFSEVSKMVYMNLHLSPKYLRKIIELAYEMNPSGRRKYKKEELLRVLGEMKV